MHNTEELRETAVLVAVQTQKQTNEQTKEYLDELSFLAETSNINTLHTFTQKLEKPDNKLYVGKGKMADIIAFVIDNDVDMIIYDDELSTIQIRNIEGEFAKFQKEVKVLDRSLLILNIFAMRAQTVQARTQVELAQQQYVLPRLTNMWTHLSKQRGGVGMRGPGEKELETDRRIAKDRIVFLKEKLELIDKQSHTQRKSRERMVRVSLVGYTNVGKSTLMRRLAKADVFAENKLFATVDSTVRKVTIGDVPFLLSDTVGFIRKLPTKLIQAFKSTLDEVREADILLHVVDISHPNYEEQIEVVNNTLTDIKAADKPIILVFNKIDLFSPEEIEIKDWEIGSGDEPVNQQSRIEKVTEFLKKSYMHTPQPLTVFISAEQKENIDELRNAILELVREKHLSIYPNSLVSYQ
ncbi:MAG: GTPase HflX [Arcicella sp.]|nr:GTPase HflX [Arcicella sp.]